MTERLVKVLCTSEDSCSHKHAPSRVDDTRSVDGINLAFADSVRAKVALEWMVECWRKVSVQANMCCITKIHLYLRNIERKSFPDVNVDRDLVIPPVPGDKGSYEHCYVCGCVVQYWG